MFSKASSVESGATEVRRPRPASNAMPSIVSANLQITGDLVCDGDIQVEGSVEGNIRSRMLTIGEGGTVKGEIEADQVTVSGNVLGKIKARTVSLSQSASVNGDIEHESLGIEAGARFEGSCVKMSSGKTGSASVETLRKDATASASGGAGTAASSSPPSASVSSQGAAAAGGDKSA